MALIYDDSTINIVVVVVVVVVIIIIIIISSSSSSNSSSPAQHLRFGLPIADIVRFTNSFTYLLT